MLFAIFLFTTLSLCPLTGLLPPSWGPGTQVVLNCICRMHLAQYMNRHILPFGHLKIWPLPKDLQRCRCQWTGQRVSEAHETDRRLGGESRVLAGLDCTTDSGSQDRSTRRAVTEMLGDTEVGSPVRVACSTHTRPSVGGPTAGAPRTAGWETWGLTVLWHSAGNESPPLFIQGPPWCAPHHLRDWRRVLG